MNLEELKKESEEYITYWNEKDPSILRHAEDMRIFCIDFNRRLSDEDYTCLKTGFDRVQRSMNQDRNLSQEDIIKLATDFFGNISEELKERFLRDVNGKFVCINEKYDHSKCTYFCKTINGKTKNFSVVFVKYTGTVYDVFVLVHEYFHSLTNVLDYKDKLTLNKTSIDAIQESISILGELICAKSLAKEYPNETLNLLYSRIYEQVYLNVNSYATLIRYISLLQKGTSIEQLQEQFDILEIRDFINAKKIPLSTEHFWGVISSVTMINDKKMEQLFNLLKEIYVKVSNQELEAVKGYIFRQIFSQKIIEIVKEKKQFFSDSKEEQEIEGKE